MKFEIYGRRYYAKYVPHKWFAWRPVEVLSGPDEDWWRAQYWVWLEVVNRVMRESPHGDYWVYWPVK